MDNFEKASREKSRFKSPIGSLTAEDLWDLSLQDLNKIAKGLNKELKSMEEDDFLKEKNTEDAKVKLAFDIVLHVLNTKKEERKKRKEATEKKAKREKLLEKLEKKQDAAYDDMSEEDLKKEISELE